MKQVNSKMYGILLVEVYLLQVFFVYITRETTYGIYPDTNYWIAYIFPLTRLGDFIIGCYLGAIFRINRTKFSFSTGSFWEIITIILICISARQYINQNIFLGQNWFRYTCLWIPTSCLIVYLFACNQGIISKILSNKFFIWLGDISPYTFLIHNIIIVYVNMFVPEILKLFFDTSIINGIVLKIVNTFIAFGGSVMSAIIWKKYRNVIFGFCK